MRFTLTIELGNDAMKNGDDLCKALRDVGQRIAVVLYRDVEISLATAAPLTRPIKDENGNTVGKWAIEKD